MCCLIKEKIKQNCYLHRTKISTEWRIILHIEANHEKEERKVQQYLKTILTSTTTWVMLWSSVWPIGLTSENSASLPECQKKYINVMLKIWQKTCSRNAERMFTICHIFITFITMNPAILFVTRWQLKKKTWKDHIFKQRQS